MKLIHAILLTSSAASTLSACSMFDPAPYASERDRRAGQIWQSKSLTLPGHHLGKRPAGTVTDNASYTHRIHASPEATLYVESAKADPQIPAHIRRYFYSKQAEGIFDDLLNGRATETEIVRQLVVPYLRDPIKVCLMYGADNVQDCASQYATFHGTPEQAEIAACAIACWGNTSTTLCDCEEINE